MMKQFVKEIMKEYEIKRDTAKKQQEERIKEVYEKIPRIEALDREMRNMGLSLSKAILNSQGNHETILEEMKEKMEYMRQQRAILLTENNIPLHYMEIQYDCNACEDTGFLKNGNKCACFKQKLINKAYSMSNIEETLEKENFNTFNINLFPDSPINEHSISPRENMVQILNVCEGFVFNFDHPKETNLLFYGPTGVGKTFLTNCIAKSLLDRGKVVIYQTAFKLIEILEQIRFHNTTDRGKYDLLFEADLLIIDDLGTEMTNSFTKSELFNILNSRLLANKKTIVSTNLTPKEIMDRYDDRIFSRLLSNSKFTILKFYGKDLRWQTS